MDPALLTNQPVLDHAITVGDLILPALAIGGILGICLVLVWLAWLFNPFRSGH